MPLSDALRQNTRPEQNMAALLVLSSFRNIVSPCSYIEKKSDFIGGVVVIPELRPT